jgi:hypothetical protein
VGVLDGEEFTMPEEGTAQGSCLSPLLGNLYLHYVLDAWFENEIKSLLQGSAKLLRFADDFIIGFERHEDAERVMKVLGKRLAKYGLTLQPEKTRLVPFMRPSRSQTSGKGPGTFTFLGMTWYWCRSRKGNWVPRCRTRHDRLRRFVRRLHRWCKKHRHEPVADQHAGIVRRVSGHINYYGVNGNGHCVRRVVSEARRMWRYWLNRRSQRSRFTWERYEDLLKSFPLPRPTVKVSIWGQVP